MDEIAELYIEENNDGEWDVYFEQPYGGRYVLESFATKSDAEIYRQEQIDSAE